MSAAIAIPHGELHNCTKLPATICCVLFIHAAQLCTEVKAAELKKTPALTARSNAKICAPSSGRFNRSATSARRRNCARHQIRPGADRGAAFNVRVRASAKAAVSRNCVAHSAHAATCLRNSAPAASGQCPSCCSCLTSAPCTHLENILISSFPTFTLRIFRTEHPALRSCVTGSDRNQAESSA